MPVLKVILTGAEADALSKLAASEHRDPRAQAGVLVRACLIEAGLLPAEPQPRAMAEAEPEGTARLPRTISSEASAEAEVADGQPSAY